MISVIGARSRAGQFPLALFYPVSATVGKTAPSPLEQAAMAKAKQKKVGRKRGGKTLATPTKKTAVGTLGTATRKN
jgi:hypothetical protein